LSNTTLTILAFILTLKRIFVLGCITFMYNLPIKRQFLTAYILSNLHQTLMGFTHEYED